MPDKQDAAAAGRSRLRAAIIAAITFYGKPIA
jgi:hypothetical protein